MSQPFQSFCFRITKQIKNKSHPPKHSHYKASYSCLLVTRSTNHFHQIIGCPSIYKTLQKSNWAKYTHASTSAKRLSESITLHNARLHHSRHWTIISGDQSKPTPPQFDSSSTDLSINSKISAIRSGMRHHASVKVSAVWTTSLTRHFHTFSYHVIHNVDVIVFEKTIIKKLRG